MGTRARRVIRRTGLIALGAVFAVAPWMSGALPRASGEVSRPAVGETRVFSRVPHPGSGGGVVVDGDTVWVAALGFGDADVDRWPVWAHDRRTGAGKADHTFTVGRSAPTVMGLRGMARDAQGRLYVVDMNGRVLRATVTSAGGRRELEGYATIPGHGNGAAQVPWPAGPSMPVDITFDAAGNAYLPDITLPAIWRVPPGGGEAALWFVDPKLQGAGFGTAATTLAPNGRDLYFSLCLSSSPHHPLEGVIYRIPVDRPTASQMTEVFRSPDSCPAGLAFGSSGKLYASLLLANQVLVLNPDGSEQRRFPSKEANARQQIPYDSPGLLALDGEGWLLVSNEALTTPEHSAILKAFVDDSPAPLAEPSLP